MEECTCSGIAQGALDVYGAGTSLQVLQSKFKDCGATHAPVATASRGPLGNSNTSLLNPSGRSNSNHSAKSAPPEATPGTR